MPAGSLALILHAHLPFVRHPEHEEFIEEDWLFEAITETYIPLITMMQRLVRDDVVFQLTMSITPPLCAMLQDELLRARYLRHLERSIALASRETQRYQEGTEVHALACFYLELLSETRRQFEEWDCDLLAQFRKLQEMGVLEIIASAATHGLLPLLAQPSEAVRAQVLIGCDVYRDLFGQDPRGFWLPECAYAPGIEIILQKANIRWFVVDAHGLSLGKPRPRVAVYAPCFTAAGPAAFARDPASSRQVWSAETGYPGDPAYREFYRDIGFDFPAEYVFADSDLKTPRFTGLKYHRITGREGAKELYRRDRAENAAKAHAHHFLEARRAQLAELSGLTSNPVIVMPFDAELFGHWWFEGPLFLDHFIRAVAEHSGELQLTTPSKYLAAHPRQEVVVPAASSWGEGGYWEVWLHETNAWIYPHLHATARRMVEMARAHRAGPSEVGERYLRQLARELLLAQASDWPFLIKNGTAKDYATQRIHDHLTRFNQLYEELKSRGTNEAFLCECETRDNLLKHVDWRCYV